MSKAYQSLNFMKLCRFAVYKIRLYFMINGLGFLAFEYAYFFIDLNAITRHFLCDPIHNDTRNEQKKEMTQVILIALHPLRGVQRQHKE